MTTDHTTVQLRLWHHIASFAPPQCAVHGRTAACIAGASPALRSALEKRPCGLTVGCHSIRLTFKGDADDDDARGDDEDHDGLKSSLVAGSAARREVETSFEARDNWTGGRKPSIALGGVLADNATPRKQHQRPHANSSYANDHCKLRLLDTSSILLDPMTSVASAPREYEVSLAFSVLDNCLGEHRNSMWWVRRMLDKHGMFLRHAGFRGRGCHTLYVTEVLQGVHKAEGSLLSLEMCDMWFFTIFLDHLATTTPLLVELEHLSLQGCHIFPTVEETVGELISHLPSLQSLTLHQFDFTLGRAKHILEAASEHACLRHLNFNDNVIRTNAQNIVMSNVQSIRHLEKFHINNLPHDFWTFGDFFAYKTNLRILQLSRCTLSEPAIRDVGHCLNVAVMLEELLLNHCGITEAYMHLLFPCIRRGATNTASSNNGMLGASSDTMTMMANGSPLIAGSFSGGSAFAQAAMGTNAPSLLQQQNDTPEDPSRTTSPAPLPDDELLEQRHGGEGGPQPTGWDAGSHAPGGQRGDIASMAPGQASSNAMAPGGLGANPFFAPAGSPLLLAFGGVPPGMGPSACASYGVGAAHHQAQFLHGGPTFMSHTICATLPHLRVLNLCDNPFGLGGLDELAAPLGRMQALEQLYLAGCGLTGDNAAESIFAALDPVAGGLFVLDLSRNRLGDRAVMELCNMNFVQKLSANVAEVFLSDVSLTQTGIAAVVRELSQHAEWLSLLDVSLNGWEGPAAMQPISSRQQHVDPTMQSPTSPFSPTEHRGRHVLCERVEALSMLLCGTVDIPAPPLTQLKINYSVFSPSDVLESLRRVARMEHHPCAPIECLQLSNMHAPAAAAPAFDPDCSTMSLLVHTLSDVLGSTLTSLDLSRNALGDDNVTDLLMCRCGSEDTRGGCISCHLHKLTTLHLRRTGFSHLVLQPPADASEEQGTTATTGLVALTELDLSANRINRDAFAKLSETVLRHLALLQRLDLSQNVLFHPTLPIVQKYPLDERSLQREAPRADAASQGAAKEAPVDEKEDEGIAATPADDAAGESTNKEDAPPSSPPEHVGYLSALRKRRYHVLDEFFRALVVAVEKCRGRLKRLKLDGNGLSGMNLQSDMQKLMPPPPCAESNILLGPLGTADWRQGDAVLPRGASWSSQLLFSVHISSS